MVLTFQDKKFWAHFWHEPEEIPVSDVVTGILGRQTPKRHLITRALLKKLHSQFARGHFDDKRTVIFWRTYCSIHEGECPPREKGQPCAIQATMQGAADCSPLDTFDRIEGRKLAFERAIAEVPRDLRTGLWDSYFENRVKAVDEHGHKIYREPYRKPLRKRVVH